MTIDQAIDRIRRLKNVAIFKKQEDDADALQLGIAALKVVKGVREPLAILINGYLPGESQE